MSRELDDVACAFAALQKTMTDFDESDTQAVMEDVIDAIFMALGSLELRLFELERKTRSDQPRQQPR